MRIVVLGLCALFLLAVFGQPADARVIVREKVKYYSINGKDGAALFKSIRKRGPRGTKTRHAIATTQIERNIRDIKTGIRGNKCVVTDVVIELKLTYLYPRWKNQRNASPKLRRTWERFEKRVIRHEKRHGEIEKKFAKQVERELRRLSGRTRNGCADFGNGSIRKLLRIAERSTREHARFDRREGWAISRVRRLERALYAGK